MSDGPSEPSELQLAVATTPRRFVRAARRRGKYLVDRAVLGVSRFDERRAGRGRPRRAIASFWFAANPPNFGDALAPVVLGHVSGARVLHVSRHRSGKVLGVGSILHLVRSGDLVWGSGLIRDEPLRLPDDVTVLAVRGPLTRDRIGADRSTALGDPAILLPRIFDPDRPARRYAAGIVPHYVDHEVISAEVHDPNVLVVDVRRPWREVISAIVACDVIVSSSLHGLIVADSYGVPASWITVSDRIIGGTFKFHDYQTSADRDPEQPTPWRRGLAAAVRRAAVHAPPDPQRLIDAWAAGHPAL